MKYKLIIIAVGLLMGGCVSKEPICEPVVQIKYQKVNVPIRCEEELPEKPKFDVNRPETAKQVSVYYEIVEQKLKNCIGDNNDTH